MGDICEEPADQRFPNVDVIVRVHRIARDHLQPQFPEDKTSARIAELEQVVAQLKMSSTCVLLVGVGL